MSDEKRNPDEDVAKGSFVLALVFLAIFVLVYFVNFKYLASIWLID